LVLLASIQSKPWQVQMNMYNNDSVNRGQEHGVPPLLHDLDATRLLCNLVPCR
jgi:hypothetical protein